MLTQIEFLYKLNPKRIKLGLEATHSFLKHLNLNHPKAKVIHIAGTNGKGSTSIIVHKLLSHLGYKTALFTSPHIIKFNERIRVNDVLIQDKDIAAFIDENKDYIIKNDLTFFEVNTVMAMAHFEKNNCDYIVLETGMGGRLDSTNCFDSAMTIITNVSLDHEAYLGNTIEEIIYEKCGIIKDHCPLICAEQNDFNFTKIAELASKKQAVDLYRIQKDSNYFAVKEVKNFSLKGWHQKVNAETAFKAIEVLLNKEMKRNIAILNQIDWPGRLEFYNESLILDVSHNKEGVQHTISYLKEHFPNKSFAIITTFSEDKNITDIFEILNSLSKEIYIYPLNHPRMNGTSLKNKLDNLRIVYQSFKHQDSLELIKTQLKCDIILVIGSHFLLEDFHKSYL